MSPPSAVTVTVDFDLIIEEIPYDPVLKFSYQAGADLYQQCHDYLVLELKGKPPGKILSSIEQCITNHFDKVDWGFQGAHLQAYLDTKLESFICNNNAGMETTPPVEIALWKPKTGDKRMRTVFVLHQSPSSQIHMIANFISQEECAAIENAATSWSGTETSDGQGGGDKPNQIRKATIARVDIPWDANGNGDNYLIQQTGHRIFEYVNHIHPSLGIREAGQEPLMAIRYQGRGRDDPHPDQYKSHCDSDCMGQTVRQGQRVATMIMYW
jgi:hypothetical protein